MGWTPAPPDGVVDLEDQLPVTRFFVAFKSAGDDKQPPTVQSRAVYATSAPEALMQLFGKERGHRPGHADRRAARQVYRQLAMEHLRLAAAWHTSAPVPTRDVLLTVPHGVGSADDPQAWACGWDQDAEREFRRHAADMAAAIDAYEQVYSLHQFGPPSPDGCDYDDDARPGAGLYDDGIGA